MEKQLKELKKQKKRISGWSISQIINRDNIDTIFQITTTNELGDVTEMNEEQVFSYFISNQEDFLIDSDCATDQMIDKLIDLDIKFETINPQSNTSLLTGVYENNLYVINATNIRLFLSFAYQIDEKIIQGHIMTVIMSKKDQPLCEYVCSNLNNTIEIINANLTCCAR